MLSFMITTVYAMEFDLDSDYVSNSLSKDLETGGVSSSEPRSGVSALMCASEEGNIETVKKLIQNGACVNAYDMNWKTPLMYAVCATKLETAQELIASGANINAKNILGATPLALAKKWSSKAMEQLLESHGATEGSVCIIL